MAIVKEELVFKPRARLLRLLGESLLRDEVIALIELVKNSYDADATLVEVELLNVKTKEGEIIVRDNGSGMTWDNVRGPWMEPGTDTKNREKFTPRGRRVLGDKGIGRFAADKIAEKLELITKTVKSPKEIYAVFDWSKYDEAVYLDEIKNHIEVREPKVIKEQGTVLILSSLRTTWNKYMANKLHVGLLRLLSPFEKVEEFYIRLISNEFPELEGELRNDIFEKAPYRIKAHVGHDGKIICNIDEQKARKINFVKDKKEEAPECGPFDVELYAWELTPDILSRLGIGVTKARKLIRVWSGVNIYRDSFRVQPYGEVGEDWLELDRRRISDPTVHFSRNQILGFVHISSESNPKIIDQTNREGLIQNSAYFDLRLCVLQIMQQLENYRIEVRKSEEEEEEERRIWVKTPAQILDEILESLSTLEPSLPVETIIQSVYEVKDIIEKREEDTIEVIARYHRNVTISQLAKNIIHELKQPTTTIIMESRNGLIALSREPIDYSFIKESFDMINERGHYMDIIVEKWTPFIRVRRQISKINICEAINNSFIDYRKQIVENKVDCYYPDPASSEIIIDIDYADAAIIFGNLLNNSLYWLEVSKTSKPKVEVSVRTDRNKAIVVFKDNGLGIEPEYYEKIFLPGWTLKEEGAGLGLSIIGEIIDDYGGKIELVSPPSGETGAIFIIELPLATGR